VELSGLLTLNGEPFANVTIYLSQRTSKKTTTGGDGKFEFKNLSLGTYTITPCKKGYAFEPSKHEAGGQTKTDLDFKAHIATYGASVDDIAANFFAKDHNGNTASLYDYFGKVILLNFSADWCPPCREEAPQLKALYDKYKANGFQVLTIQVDGDPSEWAETYTLNFPVLDDTKEKLWDIYGEGYIPLNIVLDRNCTIRYKSAGYDEYAIEEVIKKYL
jgi:peroxiredoxin